MSNIWVHVQVIKHLFYLSLAESVPCGRCLSHVKPQLNIQQNKSSDNFIIKIYFGWYPESPHFLAQIILIFSFLIEIGKCICGLHKCLWLNVGLLFIRHDYCLIDPLWARKRLRCGIKYFKTVIAERTWKHAINFSNLILAFPPSPWSRDE